MKGYFRNYTLLFHVFGFIRFMWATEIEFIIRLKLRKLENRWYAVQQTLSEHDKELYRHRKCFSRNQLIPNCKKANRLRRNVQRKA